MKCVINQQCKNSNCPLPSKTLTKRYTKTPMNPFRRHRNHQLIHLRFKSKTLSSIMLFNMIHAVFIGRIFVNR